MRRVGLSAFVVGTAVVCGLVTLVLTAVIMFITGGGFSSVLVQSCRQGVTVSSSGVTQHYGAEICTPQSPWVWLPLVIGLLGAGLGGTRAALFVRRRRPATV